MFFSHLSNNIQQLIAAQQGGGAANTASTTSASNPSGTTGIGTLSYSNVHRGYSTSGLPRVSNPDRATADIARGQHERYVRNFRGFEDALVGARDDTSLIDAAREDAPEQARLSREVAERQRSRYGVQQTAVEAREAGRASQRGEAINLAGGLNNARLAQRDANRKLLGDLINVGQGVNRSSLSQLGSAGENAVSRGNAYRAAQARGKAQTMNMVGSVAGAALMAAFMV